MSVEERKEVLDLRVEVGAPWHRPSQFEWGKWFHLSAACYEHRHLIGMRAQRMKRFSQALLKCCMREKVVVGAWVVLPNHYHVLARVHVDALFKKALGKLHGRTSHQWNVEDGMRGRKCFHSCSLRPIKSESHKWSTLNYIHHNPVKHGYAQKWSEWPYGSARSYLNETPRQTVEATWINFPIKGMGEKWDDE